MAEFDSKERDEIRQIAQQMLGREPRRSESQTGSQQRARSIASSRDYQSRRASVRSVQVEETRQRSGVAARLTSRVEMRADSVSRRVRGAAAPLAGPLAGLVTAEASAKGFAAAGTASLVTLITSIVAARIQTEVSKLHALRADRGLDIFQGSKDALIIPGIQLPLGLAAAVTLDEFKARIIASYRAFQRIATGDGFWNSLNKINEDVQRNRSMLPDASLLDDWRLMRNRFLDELRRDGEFALGWKKLGVNGG